jgi:hypothetical protein
MTNSRNHFISILIILLFTSSMLLITGSFRSAVEKQPVSHIESGVPTSQIPLRRIAFVAPDSNSLVDEFAYMATVPTSLFYSNGTQYISPLIYSKGFQSESWLIEDWSNYLSSDGGITQAIAVGDFSERYLSNLQYELGAKIYPRITGSSATSIAAQLAVSEWSSSPNAVVAIVKEDFTTPTVITGSATHPFQNQASELMEFGGSVTYGSPSSISFTPPTWAGWIEGHFNWTGSEILTHELIDPNGEVVDYSVFNQMYFSRLVGYVQSPVPLNFWLPKSMDGLWTMNITRDTPGTTSMDNEVISHPGYTQPVSVPSDAKWLNISLNWDNQATDLNLALIDPNGRLVMWAPAGSILSSPGHETIELPYPMAGDWNIIAAWMDANEEQNNIDLSWSISQLPADYQNYLESAANAAVLASLLNAPLLYVYEDAIPTDTSWALTRLGVTDIYLVDPCNLQDASLPGLLNAYATLNNILNYSIMSNMIEFLSGSQDVVVTIPAGDRNEFFAPAAFSAAAHGSPVFSLCGNTNEMTTRAQETWAPYLIGPEINNIYVIAKYENRAENGWYDERIPNKFSMMKSEDTFESFLTSRGGYNSTTSQPVVVVSPASLIPLSFDRSLQSHFNPGRIPADSAEMASVFINRGLLHRFLSIGAEQADTALVSMYAYTDGATFVDNNYDYYLLYQIENTTDALEGVGFSIESHVGQNEVFSVLDSQVALWTLSTHGTLTELPRDPPDRPNGVGYFSLRTTDAPYGFEDSLSVRESPSDSNKLVNPVAFPEVTNHIVKSTHELDAALDNIGSPIVILTACLLGGTEMPTMLMEHGAVAVTASPRTVYFQPAGMLSVLLAQKLSEGSTIGEALSYGLRITSSDYSDPLPDRDPRDYANQQVLFGDPSVRLYEPSTSPHIVAEDPTESSFDTHTPDGGVSDIAALGVSSYLPSTLTSLGVGFDYYESTNFTDFINLLALRHTVLIEPDTLDDLSSNLSPSSSVFNDYVRNGGTLVIFGVSDSLSWLPWPVTFTDSGSGTSITIEDVFHPLLTSPNTLGTTMNHSGYFSNIWSNFSILATDGQNPVIIAGTVGSGKIALTTTNPTGISRNMTIENAIAWSDAPSITLSELSLSQEIIWAGDRVTILMKLTDLVGNEIESLDVYVWLNESQFIATDQTNGYYSVTVGGNWTSSNLGEFNILVVAYRTGYDTLRIQIEDFILIRQFPTLMLALLGGGFLVVIGGWVYLRKKRGDHNGLRNQQTPEERRREQERREKDKESNIRDYFGV